MSIDLTTTNVLLGIMAAVNVLEVLAVVGMAAAGFAIYRRVLRVVDGLEERQVAPAVARINTILDDVKGVTATVKKETGHIEQLVEWVRTRRRAADQPSGSAM